MDALDGWRDFNVAMVGAAAALAGLVIVASSVNIAEIVKATTITARLGAGIAALVLVITLSGVGLMPELALPWYGALVLLATVGAGAFQVHATFVIVRDSTPAARWRVGKAVLGFLPILAYLAGGVAVFIDPVAGLALTAVGCLMAIASAIVVSWVALVEVLR